MSSRLKEVCRPGRRLRADRVQRGERLGRGGRGHAGARAARTGRGRLPAQPGRPEPAGRPYRLHRPGHTAELHSPYFSELAALLVKMAQDRSWTVIIDQTAGDADPERRLLEHSGGRVVDGLIISPWASSAEELSAAARTMPLVLLGECSPQGLADRVAVDSVLAAEEATTHLLELGRRRVAAIGLQPHLGNGTAEQRSRGHRNALRRAGLSPDPALEVPVDALHRADGARAMTHLLDSGARPDAVFAFTDELALGALSVAYARGLRVPEDLALVGFDDIEDGRYSTVPLTTIAPDKRQLAERTLQCLADRVFTPRNRIPPLDVVVPHRLEARASIVGHRTEG